MSTADLDNFFVAMDGLLIQAPEPNTNVFSVSAVSSENFFCRHKSKFGLNFQGARGMKGSCLVMPVGYPGFSYDFLAFAASKLHSSSEKPGFLASGLVLCGGIVRTSNSYVAATFESASSGSEDVHDYYQSQVSDRVQCSFEMIVRRLSILRRHVLCNAPLKKPTALARCSQKLYNCCK